MRRETGAESRMKESHREGVASHPDPEPCGCAREDAAEALGGAHAGKVLSREITYSRVPTLLTDAEGNTRPGANASPGGALRGRRPLACVETPCAGTGRSQGHPAKARRVASGRPEAVRR